VAKRHGPVPTACNGSFISCGKGKQVYTLQWTGVPRALFAPCSRTAAQPPRTSMASPTAFESLERAEWFCRRQALTDVT